MRPPLAMSNGCAPVLASYSAITLFTSSMSAVAGSYSRSVVSPWDEKVRILAFMFGLLRDVHLRSSVEQQSAGFGSLPLILHRFSELSIHNGHSTPYSQKPNGREKSESWSECERLASKTVVFRTLIILFRWLAESTACRWSPDGVFGTLCVGW